MTAPVKRKSADDAGDIAHLRVPPHSVEAEHGVLGALFQDNAAWSVVRDHLAESHFYRHEHRTIFAAMRALLDTNAPVDVITVFEQLQRFGKVDECGGHDYLNALATTVPSASNIRRYVEIVREKSQLRQLAAAADEIATSAFAGRDPHAAVEAARELIADIAAGGSATTERFVEVDLSHLGHLAPDHSVWPVARYVPPGQVTLLGGHGGSGKSYLALQMAACVAVGVPSFGSATVGCPVAVFSAEDPASVVLPRLDRICRDLGLDVDAVRRRLHVLDVTDFDPALFVERHVDGVTVGVTTAAYAALALFVERHQIGFVVVDNASDTFDAEEVKRRPVRAFVRSLQRLVKPRGGAVLLLAHVDKGTSRAAKGQGNTEGYSGNTAWHNSVRSRLFLLKKEQDVFELQHQKCNLGPTADPITLEWSKGGMLQLVGAGAAPGGGMVQAITDSNETKALLALIHEYHSRGEFVKPAPNSPRCAAKLLAGEKTFPKRKATEITHLLREAERKGWLDRGGYRDSDRKHQDCWVLTPAGCQVVGVAPSAPSPSPRQTAVDAGLGAPKHEARQGFAQSAPSPAEASKPSPGAPLLPVRQVAQGGCGGVERAQTEDAVP